MSQVTSANNAGGNGAVAAKTPFGNFKIGQRVSAIVVLGIVSMAVFGGIQLFGQSRVTQAVGSNTEYNRLAQESQEVQSQSLQMRRAEKDFLLRRDMKYVDAYKGNVTKLKAVLAAMRKEHVAEAKAETLTRLEGAVDAHAKQFAAVVGQIQELGLDEKAGLQGTLRGAVHAVETKLDAANLDGLTVKMLMMRRHEKDFMLRGDEKYIDRVAKRQSEFLEMLPATPLSDADKTDITKLLDVYVAAFNAFAKLTVQNEAAINELSTIYKVVTPAVDELVAFGEQGAKRALVTMDDTQRSMDVLMLVGAAVIFIVFVALGIAVAASITRPVQAVTKATETLAEGDWTVQIPALENKDEVGAVARALQVFKENLIKAKELEEAQRLEQARQVERAQKLASLTSKFDATVSEVLSVVSSASNELQATATSMRGTAETTTRQSSSVAAACEQTAANVQTVATATEELTAS
ncbi:MAG: HAMP domain-containing protein, partial [Rhodospirillales bacterium]